LIYIVYIKKLVCQVKNAKKNAKCKIFKKIDIKTLQKSIFDA